MATLVSASMAEGESSKDLKGFKVAVIATDGFEQAELQEPVKALKAAHATVDIISLKSGSIQGFKHQDKADKVAVGKTLNDVKAADYNGLLLPGGALNADALRTVPEAQAFVTAFDVAQKPIAVICHAPWLLVSADLVKGRTLTSYHTIEDDIINAGGHWEDKEVVVDRNLVSSRQPSDIPAFNRAMIQLFAQSMAPQTPADLLSSIDHASGLSGLPEAATRN